MTLWRIFYEKYFLVSPNKHETIGINRSLEAVSPPYLHSLVVPPVQVRNMVKVHNMYAKILIIN